MNRIKRFFFLSAAFLLLASSPGLCEKISLKISYNTASVSGGDVNEWIRSYNTQWNDWQSYINGQLDGQFNPLTYGPKYEVELSIPLIWGLALNLSGGHFSSSEEGSFTLLSGIKNQTETDFLRNKIRGIPIKIGFSYRYPIPYVDNLFILGGLGRHITFIKYESTENYELEIVSFGQSFSYFSKKEYEYNSEALGLYATVGVEYDLIKQVAIVVEAEKVWAKADGFKGPFNREDLRKFPGKEIREIDSGEASLYFYENKPSWSDKTYSALAGYKTRPEDASFSSIRQGEFDLGTFSFKIGIRFKF